MPPHRQRHRPVHDLFRNHSSGARFLHSGRVTVMMHKIEILKIILIYFPISSATKSMARNMQKHGWNIKKHEMAMNQLNTKNNVTSKFLKDSSDSQGPDGFLPPTESVFLNFPMRNLLKTEKPFKLIGL